MGKHAHAKKKAHSHQTNRKKKKGGVRQPVASRHVKETTSHYDLLRVSRDADAEAIRASYLALVREFSPETHPDQFQRIRSAYEVLKDPEARRQYDRERFYGASVGALRKKANDLMDRERIQDAVEVLRMVVDIQPNATNYLSLADGYASLQQRTAALEIFDKALEYAEDGEEKSTIEIERAHVACTSDPEIIKELIAIGERASAEVRRGLIATEVFAHYQRMEQVSKGIAYSLQLIPQKGYLTADEFYVYLQLLEEIDQHEGMAKEFKRVRKLATSAARQAARGPYQEEISVMILEFVRELSFVDSNLGLTCLELARVVDPTNENIQTLTGQMVDEVDIESELMRMVVDNEAEPQLVLMVLHGLTTQLKMSLPPSLMTLMKKTGSGVPVSQNPTYAVAIFKKKYPYLYGIYEEEIVAWKQRAEAQKTSQPEAISRR